MLFSLAGNLNFLAIDGCVDRYTCRTPHFHMQSHCTEQTTCVHGARCLTSSSPNCVPKHSLIYPHTEHQHKVLSHSHLLWYIRLLLRLQTCCPRIHWPTAKIHGRMALPRNAHLSQAMSPKGSSSTGPCSTYQIRKLTIRMILRKLVSNRCPTANH